MKKSFLTLKKMIVLVMVLAITLSTSKLTFAFSEYFNIGENFIETNGNIKPNQLVVLKDVNKDKNIMAIKGDNNKVKFDDLQINKDYNILFYNIDDSLRFTLNNDKITDLNVTDASKIIVTDSNNNIVMMETYIFDKTLDKKVGENKVPAKVYYIPNDPFGGILRTSSSFDVLLQDTNLTISNTDSSKAYIIKVGDDIKKVENSTGQELNIDVSDLQGKEISIVEVEKLYDQGYADRNGGIMLEGVGLKDNRIYILKNKSNITTEYIEVFSKTTSNVKDNSTLLIGASLNYNDVDLFIFSNDDVNETNNKKTLIVEKKESDVEKDNTDVSIIKKEEKIEEKEEEKEEEGKESPSTEENGKDVTSDGTDTIPKEPETDVANGSADTSETKEEEKKESEKETKEEEKKESEKETKEEEKKESEKETQKETEENASEENSVTENKTTEENSVIEEKKEEKNESSATEDKKTDVKKEETKKQENSSPKVNDKKEDDTTKTGQETGESLVKKEQENDVEKTNKSSSSSGGGGGAFRSNSKSDKAPTSKVNKTIIEYNTNQDNFWVLDKQTNKWYFNTKNKNKLKNLWANIKNTQNNIVNTYHFNTLGFMDSGWIMQDNKWYYLSTNNDASFGSMIKNWHFDKKDNNWYYLNPDNGSMMTGWVLVNGKWYYLNPNASSKRAYGSMYKNERTPDGYYVNSNGEYVK